MGTIRNEKFEIKRRDGKAIRGKIYIPLVTMLVPHRKRIGTEDDFIETIYFKEDGIKETAAKWPVVIFAHGFGWAYPYMESTAKKFAKNGIAFALFDFCGGAENSSSEGDTTDMSIKTEAEDLSAVISYVRTLEYADPDNIFLLGESQGGIVSAYVAAQRLEDIRGIILKYPAFCIPDDNRAIIERDYDGDISNVPENMERMGMPVGKRYITDTLDMDPYTDGTIQAYKGPVLICHGCKDTLVPISYAQRAAEMYADAQFISYQGAGHGFYGTISTKFQTAAMQFVKDHVCKEGKEMENSPAVQQDSE